MNWNEVISSFKLIPISIRHLKKIKKKLHGTSYQILIHEHYQIDAVNNISIYGVVKSYFWASRLVKDCHCLPRSIALYQYLKAAGFDVEHKFGVNKSDKSIAAHAWVEYQQKPLNESDDLKERFVVLEKPNVDSIESLK